MSRASPFALISSQRSGSSWLTDLLASHPSICMYAEVFLDRPRAETDLNRHLLPAVRYHEFRQEQRGVRPLLTWRYLDLLRRSSPDRAAVGFKLMYSQAARLPEIAPGLFTRRFRVIHLIRDNALNVLISGELMRRHRRVHVSRPAETAQITLDTDVLRTRLRRHRRNVTVARLALRAARLPVLEVRYEQLEAAPDGELRRISEFLGVESFRIAPESRYVRVNRGSQQDKLSNYDQVRAVLAGTPEARYLT